LLEFIKEAHDGNVECRNRNVEEMANAEGQAKQRRGVRL
jgi:hypothetical protein